MKELFLNGLLFALIMSLIFGSILTIVLWYSRKHPFSGKVIGKAVKNGKFILTLEDSKKREAKIITDETTWFEVEFYDQYTKKEKESYYLS
jgi:hypothetical protein